MILFSILSSGDHFVQWSGNVSATFGRRFMVNI